MCLTQPWFDQRHTAMDRLTYLGHADLKIFLSACGYTPKQLMAAGILQRKKVWSTAMLLEHEPAPRYKSLFVVREDYDILMVKKGKGVQLVAAMQALRASKRSTPNTRPPRT